MWSSIDVKETQRKLKTNINVGLTQKEAVKRREEVGDNKLLEAKKEKQLIKFIKQFNDFMIIALIVAACLSAFVSLVENTNDYIDSVIIVAIVILNVTVGLIQENKAEKSIEALNKLTAPKAKVKRDNKIQIIESQELVPGDIITIEAGDYVPADCRLIKSYNLKVEESSLTGETIPVLKDADIILDKNTSIGDMKNLIFATTIVVNGHAEAIVINTGMNTKVGNIAGMIIKDKAPETPLQKRLRRCRQKTWNNIIINLCFNFFYWNNKEDTNNANFYDFSWISSCSNTRRLASSSNNYVINRSYKNGKK